MNTTAYLVTARSLITFKEEPIRIEVHGNDDPKVVAERVTSMYGAEVVSIVPESPAELLRNLLRECLGFAQAWQAHLSDTNKDRAAETVQEVIDRSSFGYRYTAPAKG